MSVLVVGIDPSSRKIALVAADPHLVGVFQVEAHPLYQAKEKQTPESLGRALDVMETFVSTVSGWAPGNRYAWVEDPLMGRGGPVATMKQSLVQGIVRGVLARSGFTVYGVNVSTWKKVVTGDGRADKDKVRRTVGAEWPKIAERIRQDDDLSDAAAICLYGHRILRRTDDIAAPAPRPRTVRLAARPAGSRLPG